MTGQEITVIGVGVGIISTLIAVIKFLFARSEKIMSDQLLLYQKIIHENEVKHVNETEKNLNRIKEVETKFEEWKNEDKAHIMKMLQKFSDSIEKSAEALKNMPCVKK
jgi:hypothetical protein